MKESLKLELQLLWSYLAAMQIYDLETNAAVERFREVRYHYNKLHALVDKMEE